MHPSEEASGIFEKCNENTLDDFEKQIDAIEEEEGKHIAKYETEFQEFNQDALSQHVSSVVK